MAHITFNRKYKPAPRVKVGFVGPGTVTVDRIAVDRNPWYVVDARAPDGARFCVVGVFQSTIREGDKVYIRGGWENTDYGWQFKIAGGFVMDLDKADLTNESGIELWLTRLPQIGHQRAEAIVARFGTDVMTVLDTDAQQLLEIDGITEPRLEAILEAYEREKLDADLLVWLYSLGLSDRLIKHAVAKWGSDLREVVEHFTYDLIVLPGARWEEIDAAGLAQGFSAGAEDRVGAALWLETMAACRRGGHTLANETLVVNKAMLRLEISSFRIIEEVLRDPENTWVVYEDGAVSPHDLYHAEAAIAAAIYVRTEEN